MNPTLPLWVLTLGAPMSVPLSTHDLAHFSARWSVEFQEVAPNADPRGEAADAQQSESVRRIEALLSAARTSIGALRGAEADSALSEAEALIREHSELPQAAWLLAEHHAILAEHVEESDPRLANELLMRAAVLEGERAEAFRDARGRSAHATLPAQSELLLLGTSPRDELEWDGAPRALPLATQPGEHHVRVVRAGRLLWSGWVTVGEGAREVDLHLPSPAPCSADDLSATSLGPEGPRAGEGTACADWAVARVVAGELRVARCERERCGKWQTPTPRVAAQSPQKPLAPSEEHKLPRWLSYAAVGVGVALVTSVVLIQTGAFEGSGSSRERWLYSGLK